MTHKMIVRYPIIIAIYYNWRLEYFLCIFGGSLVMQNPRLSPWRLDELGTPMTQRKPPYTKIRFFQSSTISRRQTSVAARASTLDSSSQRKMAPESLCKLLDAWLSTGRPKFTPSGSLNKILLKLLLDCHSPFCLMIFDGYLGVYSIHHVQRNPNVLSLPQATGIKFRLIKSAQDSLPGPSQRTGN